MRFVRPGQFLYGGLSLKDFQSILWWGTFIYDLWTKSKGMQQHHNWLKHDCKDNSKLEKVLKQVEPETKYSKGIKQYDHGAWMQEWTHY
jgi:hypothetical protein